MDDAAVLDLFIDVGRLARQREAGETRAAGHHAPAWQADFQRHDLGDNVLDIDIFPRQPRTKRRIIREVGVHQPVIVLGNDFRRNSQHGPVDGDKTH